MADSSAGTHGGREAAVPPSLAERRRSWADRLESLRPREFGGSFTAPGPPQSALPTAAAAAAATSRPPSRLSAAPPLQPQADGQRSRHGGGRVHGRGRGRSRAGSPRRRPRADSDTYFDSESRSDPISRSRRTSHRGQRRAPLTISREPLSISTTRAAAADRPGGVRVQQRQQRRLAPPATGRRWA